MCSGTVFEVAGGRWLFAKGSAPAGPFVPHGGARSTSLKSLVVSGALVNLHGAAQNSRP